MPELVRLKPLDSNFLVGMGGNRLKIFFQFLMLHESQPGTDTHKGLILMGNSSQPHTLFPY